MYISKNTLLLLSLLLPLIPLEKKHIRVYLVGDSTMAKKEIKAYPETGWGMPFSAFFDSTVTVENRAQNGRSTKSFIAEKRWQKITDSLQQGDYVLIQFGHNDEVPTKPTYTSPEEFQANLVKFITESREKKAIPVLITPVARRKFDSTGQVEGTHEAYSALVRSVAARYQTPLIDLDKQSQELLAQFGDEKSKLLFNWLKPGEHPNYPKGMQDNTHFSELGARRMAQLVLAEIRTLRLELADRIVVPGLSAITQKHADFVVAQDGSGQFKTVQEAINAVPDMRKKETVIYIKNGVYKEKLVLPESKSSLTFIGESVENTILTYDDFHQKKNRFGEEIGTSGSAGFFIYGTDFSAENITFRNTAGPVGQAVAVLVSGDRARFRNCRFLGFQDTLYTYGRESRQYYNHCYIEGTVDFIFGSSTAVFDSCTVFCKTKGYVSAASTPENKRFGYVFLHCTITGDSPAGSFVLGRPWRPFAKTVFVACSLGGQIAPEGWSNWNNAANEKKAYYAEYKNTGEGAKTGKRVPWSHQLTDAEAAMYTVKDIFTDWDPLVR